MIFSTKIKTVRIRQHFFITLCCLSLFNLRCSQGGKTGLGGQFDDSLWGGKNSKLGGLKLSPQDMAAANAVLGENQAMAPVDGQASTIPPELQQPINNALNTLSNPNATQAQKSNAVSALSQYAAQLLQSCMSDIQKYFPIPGETLQGVWAESNCAYGFVATLAGGSSSSGTSSSSSNSSSSSSSSSSSGSSGSSSSSSGATGTLNIVVSGYEATEYCQATASSDGSAKTTYCSLGSSGWATDQPQAGTGQAQSKDGCQANLTLVTPTNKIPQKFQAYIQHMASCYRQALVLQSGIMQDPKTAAAGAYLLGMK